MANTAESLFKTGAISRTQRDKIPILRKTKSGVPTNMEPFHGKQGKRDQGGVRDRGEVPVNEIEHPTNQKTGSPAHAGGLPSKGGRARGGAKPDEDHINQAALQKPAFPKGGSTVKKGSKRVGVVGPPGKSSGPFPEYYYGGPPNRKYG